jgi:hypothetical protein
MKMITPGVADSLTPHSWYTRERRSRSPLRLRLLGLRPAGLRLPTVHLPRLRPRHPQH